MKSDALIDSLLQMVFRNACFAGMATEMESEAPRERGLFELAVDGGRERLYPALQETSNMLAEWFKEATVVRQALDDVRVRLLAAAAAESREHLQRLLTHAAMLSTPQNWLRQLPRYLKAEQRRWQRNAVRGTEPANISRELYVWQARFQDLERRLTEELRWTPMLDDLRFWIEEYRVSLYAQELKTLGPISAARLEERTAEIEAWLRR
jgi:ATP-dependent helicase HrpA